MTVNSALSAAIVGAQSRFPASKPLHPSLTTAASLRDRLPHPPGEGMGFYVGGVRLNFIYDTSYGFWENARRLHRKLKPLFNNKELFKDMLPWCCLQTEILDSINFKKLGGLVPANSRR